MVPPPGQRLIRARYLEMVRLAGLLGADDPEDLSGAAASRVTSVTAVLPDGQTFAGAVRARLSRGVKAWTLGYPQARDVRLIFRNAAGHQVADLAPNAPIGPPQRSKPSHGGVRVYSYPASAGEPAGQVNAYLVDGRVGFWSPMWGGTISPVPASGAPVLGGLTEPFNQVSKPGEDYWSELQAFGYAHADVTRVVLRSSDGGQVSASMIDVSGAGLRLWTASVPASMAEITGSKVTVTATAYDAAGQVVGHVQLGHMQ